MPSKEKILVITVDRDNDIGRKAGINNMVLGREPILKAAQKFALADPTDSDMNAIYQAVKTMDELTDEYNVQVALLVGDEDVGVKSDKKITDQLKKALKEFPADAAVLVSDGAEDEHIIPIIQSFVPIISVNRVIVRQAEELESSYFKIKDFINETLDNPKYARLFFGLPAIIMILWAFFGAEGWRAVVGFLGVYLLIKGFKLEDYVYNAVNELTTSFARRRFAFFIYVVSIAFAILGTYNGYTSMQGWLASEMFETAASFVNSSVYYYLLSMISAWLGRVMNKRKELKKGARAISIPLFGLAIAIVVYTTTGIILTDQFSLVDFLASIGFGFALLAVAFIIEWKG